MPVNLESIRVVARPYVARKVALGQFLESVWPLLLGDDPCSSEIVESLEALLALHASRAIDDEALRQRIAAFVFSPAMSTEVHVRNVKVNQNADLEQASLQRGPRTFGFEEHLVQIA